MSFRARWLIGLAAAIVVIAAVALFDLPGPDRTYGLAAVIALVALFLLALGRAASRSAATPAHDVRETRELERVQDEARGKAYASEYLSGNDVGSIGRNS
jgi:hypothetical protein